MPLTIRELMANGAAAAARLRETEALTGVQTVALDAMPPCLPVPIGCPTGGGACVALPERLRGLTLALAHAADAREPARTPLLDQAVTAAASLCSEALGIFPDSAWAANPEHTPFATCSLAQEVLCAFKASVWTYGELDADDEEDQARECWLGVPVPYPRARLLELAEQSAFLLVLLDPSAAGVAAGVEAAKATPPRIRLLVQSKRLCVGETTHDCSRWGPRWEEVVELVKHTKAGTARPFNKNAVANLRKRLNGLGEGLGELVERVTHERYRLAADAELVDEG